MFFAMRVRESVEGRVSRDLEFPQAARCNDSSMMTWSNA